MGDASRVGGWQQVALLAAAFSGLLLTAKVFARSEAKTEARPDAGLTLISSRNTVPVPAVSSVAKVR